MLPEQQELFDRLTHLQQRVATGVLAGMTQRQAYYAAEGSAKSDTAADTSASEIMNNPKVKTFMDAMKKQAVSNAIMSRDEMLARLSLIGRKGVKDIVRFQTSVIGKDMVTGDDLQQTGWFIPDSALQNEDDLSIIESIETTKNGPKIKTYSSISAMALIAKIQGYEAPQKVDHSSTDGSMAQPTRIEIVAPSMAKTESAD